MAGYFNINYTSFIFTNFNEQLRHHPDIIFKKQKTTN